jgi:hypothetical protein
MGGGGYIDPFFLPKVSDQHHTLAALSKGKESRYSLDRRLGGPLSRSRRYGEVKILEPTGSLSSP